MRGLSCLQVQGGFFNCLVKSKFKNGSFKKNKIGLKTEVSYKFDYTEIMKNRDPWLV